MGDKTDETDEDLEMVEIGEGLLNVVCGVWCSIFVVVGNIDSWKLFLFGIRIN